MTASAPPQAELARQARAVNRALARLYPDAQIELHFSTALELLVAAILAAQCTDHRVNEVTPALFARYRSELEELIRPTGFFRAKAGTLLDLARSLCDRHGGHVPDSLAELSALPGVGRKTANLVLGDAFGKPGLAVDTHFARLAQRLGWTTRGDRDKIEQDVAALLPPRDWTAASHRLTWHGRRVCHARNPACGACGIARQCPSFGLGPTDDEAARKLIKPGPFS